jgi:hypothetical protein
VALPARLAGGVELGGDQVGERVEEGDEVVAEADSGVGVDADVAGGELHGGGHGVGVEEGEGSGDPHGTGKLVIVEQAAEELEVVVAAEPAACSEGSSGHADTSGAAGLLGPADEGPDMPAGGGWFGQPGVEVGLAEAGKVSALSGEPVEELGGDGHALPSGEDVALAELALVRQNPEAALVVPGDELLDDAALCWVADGGELGDSPVVEADEEAVPAGQDLVGDEELSELVDQVGTGEFVEGGVVELEPTGGEIGQRAGDQGASQSDEGGVGDGERSGPHRVEHGCKSAGGRPGGELVEPVIEETAGAQLPGVLVGLDAAASAHQVDRHPRAADAHPPAVAVTAG